MKNRLVLYVESTITTSENLENLTRFSLFRMKTRWTLLVVLQKDHSATHRLLHSTSSSICTMSIPVCCRRWSVKTLNMSFLCVYLSTRISRRIFAIDATLISLDDKYLTTSLSVSLSLRRATENRCSSGRISWLWSSFTVDSFQTPVKQFLYAETCNNGIRSK